MKPGLGSVSGEGGTLRRDELTETFPRPPSNEQTLHTPGPWKIENGEIVAITEGGSVVLGVVYGSPLDHELPEELNPECAANARLIAAAPELLQSLTELLAILQTEYYLTTAETLVCQKAIDVIATVKPPTEGSEHA